MSPSRPFILRPVATTLLMIAIMLSGMVAYRFLPLAALPEVDYPTIQVSTFYPGASPDVTTPSTSNTPSTSAAAIALASRQVQRCRPLGGAGIVWPVAAGCGSRMAAVPLAVASDGDTGQCSQAVAAGRSGQGLERGNGQR